MSRYKLWLALAATIAFATAGIAVASEPHAETQAVAATFNAEMKRSKTQTCQGADGTYKVTNAVYWGLAESDNPLLDGRIRLHLKGFYSVSDELGKVTGEVHIRNEETDKRAHARLVAVNSKGNLEGMLIGVAGRPRAKFYANFTAKLSDSAVSDGEIGAGSSGNLALLFSRGCRRMPEVTATEREQREQERKEERQEKKERPVESSGK